ncbi:putative hybrid PKS-NRPS enzyme [Teratosphaeria nubilosa]|uniref:Putative hybrid PKS-NRPS enzyme n=1 Tax=Teratosphaeria nubilosa TaxID=161662 RepID=A0A6G1LK96_9PEZI|nr:putative hybrid PKS-NRPS enzyme [Teratosphaeria nubilosa]
MSRSTEPIAIIGSGCRFPGGASSPSKLWDLLEKPQDVLVDFPPDRLNLGAFHDRNGEHHGKTDVCNKAYLIQEDIRHFDSSFFNVNPAEADAMDPQQRLALETVFESLEAAGYTLQQIAGSLTSVYLGVMTSDYRDIQLRDPETINRYHPTGTTSSILSNRISYYFDLKGPSMTLDTACSSSLVALHLAVQSLRNGEASMAIAAGVNLIMDPAGYVSESKLHMLSPTSRSRMWDALADGYARGEGIASVLLKPLRQAIADGDHIECVIRETGVNSDGRTPGITMPSSDSQAKLIRSTYEAAGLDPIADRPQYFECHGTGTQAGDPVEARAIYDSFFNGENEALDPNKLYCGSIKSVIGHTEGCAGLAGLLKASLALQMGTIPPNMLFNDLNPAIAPYYHRLLVPTDALPWPTVARGPRRASVNSFGFGGTNAHAILENYVPDIGSPGLQKSQPTPGTAFVGPLLLSSETEASLLATVQHFADYIRSNPALNLEDLAHTTHVRRTAFAVRAPFAAATRDGLIEALEQAVEKERFVVNSPSTQSATGRPALLGIFTGQGAQWAAMGRSMYLASDRYRQSIDACETALQNIAGAPTWSLTAELMMDDDKSRVGEAALSQPLCTATQIALVDVLEESGVQFDAVVGHSSGEIAAAYASGYLSAADAVRIAYYRGLCAKDISSHGKKGAMMAIGYGYEDAIAFLENFSGCVSLAASNSPTSTTISGDHEAIQEAKAILDELKVFARILNVDTAYHSHHMLSCADAYLEALRACDIKVHTVPSNKCVWISSVYGNAEMLEDEASMQSLADQYWVDNMVKPVLFSEAVECALWRAGPFHLAVEVGPHPALKGPSSQTIKKALASDLPYTGMLRRGEQDVSVFSSGLGFIWAVCGPYVDFHGWRKAMFGPFMPRPTLPKGLPTYAWDHNKIHWKESRPSRRYRLAEQPPHELLGRRLGDDDGSNRRWRNILKLNELPWLSGHAFQGQPLFATSAYMAVAIEAAMEIAGTRPVRIIEIRDLTMPRGFTVPENHPGVETIFSVKRLDKDEKSAHFHGEFSFSTASSDAIADLEQRCSGSMTIEFGESCLDALPPRPPTRSDLIEVEPEACYDQLLGVGLDYQGPFRGLKSVRRGLGYCAAHAAWKRDEWSIRNYVMHPGPLDVAFHCIIPALCSPLSGALWAPYLPVKVGRLAVIPQMTYGLLSEDLQFDIDAFITKSTKTTFEGDVHITDPSGRTGLVAEGLLLQRVKEGHPFDDRPLFSKTIWDVDRLSSSDNLDGPAADSADLALAEDIERTALYYLNQLFGFLQETDVANWKWHHRAFYSAASHVLAQTRFNKHATALSAWLEDDEEQIVEIRRKHPNNVDLELMHAVGKSLHDVMTGDTQLLEVMLEDDMLSNFYTQGRIFAPLNKIIGDLMQNITHKFPRADILEIGAGTGGTTASILNSVGDAYGHYLYTDVSAGFFENAKQRFAAESGRLSYKVLDIEQDPLVQGLQEGSQDIIVAANVLHATRNLHETLSHVRTLLKPGGFLLMMEVTGDTLENLLIMGGLPGWWLGIEEGRSRGPGINLTEWDALLQSTGFTGADKFVMDHPDDKKHACSVIVSQATDQTLSLLLDPMSHLDDMPLEKRLLIVGGSSLQTSRIVRTMEKFVSRFAEKVMVARTIDDLTEQQLEEKTSVICLSDLDEPLFSRPVTQDHLSKLQSLYSAATNFLWVTSDRLNGRPHANMSVGLGRALITELPHLNLQFLDLDSHRSPNDPGTIVEWFLKLSIFSAHDSLQDSMLWCTELEVVLRDGQSSIPRVVLDKERNDRLNSSRRTIDKSAMLQETAVDAEYSGGKLSLKEQSPWTKGSGPEPETSPTLCVRQSVSLPFADFQPIFLSWGHLEGSGQTALAISHAHGSRITVPTNHILVHKDEHGLSDGALSATAVYLSALLAGSVISREAPREGTVVIYDAMPDLARALLEVSASKVVFAYSRSENIDVRDGKTIRLHARSSEFSVRSSLPRDTCYFVDFSTSPNDLIREHLNSMYPGVKFTPNMRAAENLLGPAFKAARTSQLANAPTTIVAVQDLPRFGSPSSLYPNVVDWSQMDQPVIVDVEPINGAGLFSPKKTYVMIGLNSDLGRSICKWMVEHGARHIVIASRSANVGNAWLSEMECLGASIKTFRMDVSNRNSVQALYDDIKASLPAIGGVCNGALVLQDQLFLDMKADALNEVFAPKVDGTVFLNEIFTDSSIDFFISFSSTSSIMGNAGQSNYNAASLFQAALADQRRAKGLPASVLTLGIVVDVGYIAQRGPGFLAKLNNIEYYVFISESDVHTIFAEAVAASKPCGPEDTVEIISGIKPFAYNASTKRFPPWFRNPRFSHFVREVAEEGTGDGARDTSSTLQVRSLMDNAASEDDAAAALTGAFASKLESMLQMTAGSIKVDASLLDLGIDSLLAVEIRTWFLREAHVDIPVLMVLGGDSVRDISAEAAKRYLSAKMAEAGAQTASGDTETVADTRSQSVLPGSARNTDTTNSSAESTSGRSMSPANEGAETPLSDQSSSSSAVEPKPELETVREEKLSFAQSRIWFLHRLSKDPTQFNSLSIYNLRGLLQISRLRRALATVVGRHECLHSCFYTKAGSGDAVQAILKHPRDCFKHVVAHDQNALESEIELLKHHTWTLGEGKGLRVVLVSRSAEDHSLLIGYHHMIMDGIGHFIFLQEVSAAYMGKRLAPVKVGFLDLCARELRSLQEGRMDDHIHFWNEEMSPPPEVIDLLPFASVNMRPVRDAYVNNEALRELGGDLTSRIKSASRDLSVTPFYFHMAALQTLLYRLLGNSTVCIGTTDANRTSSQSNIIGFFLNMVPVRLHMSRDDLFSDLVSRANRKHRELQQHADLPFSVLLEKLRIERDPSHTPIFQVAINYRQGNQAEIPFGNAQLSVDSVSEAKSPYDIALTVTPAGDTSYVQLVTRADLYTPEATNKLADMYVNLLEQLSDNTQRAVNQYDLHTEREKHAAIRLGRPRNVDFGWPETLSEKIDSVVAEHPNSPAASDDKGNASYTQLQQQVYSIASAIAEHCNGRPSRIAVICEPSIDGLASMLAVIRSGAAFVPLDGVLPDERLTAILKASAPDIVICHDATLSRASNIAGDICLLNISAIAAASVGKAPNLEQHGRTTFILFTSGSTGTPKGIKLSQIGIINYLASKAHRLSLQREVVLQQSALGFDMCLAQTFHAIARGGTLVVAPQASRGDPVALSKLMVESNVTMTIATPTEYLMLLRYGGNQLRLHHTWQNACSGGEAVTSELKRLFSNLHKPPILTDCYGPTEVSCCATMHTINLDDPNARDSEGGLVGVANPNTSIYILDKDGQCLPIGMPGEIAIGGLGVALGYLDPELSAQKFVPNTFEDLNDAPQHWGRNLYKSGDEGVLRSDGVVQYIGRLDNDTTVKLRGLRVDLQDISTTIIQASNGSIMEAVVTIRGEPANLVAHVVLSPGTDLENHDLKRWCSTLPLPKYMQPSVIVRLPSLPMSPNGKVDRRAISALPLPQSSSASNGAIQRPLSLVEGELKLLWAHVLGQMVYLTAHLSVESDFFEAGGTSMSLVKLQAAVRSSMGVELPLQALYKASTLGSMAAMISDCRHGYQPLSLDWASETALLKDFDLPCIQGPPVRAPSQGLEVLLTGSTAFLGKAILASLLQNPAITRVHCIAVDSDSIASLARDNQDSRVSVYPGHLSEKHLGLDLPTFTRLQKTVDRVVLAGAHGHCLNNYTSLRMPNVHSTQQMAIFALPRRIPVHYISSNRVTLLGSNIKNTALPPVSVADQLPPIDGGEGFTASKWASEVILENLTRRTQGEFPVTIHRTCALIGPDAPLEDALNALLRYSLRLKTIPNPSSLRVDGYLDFEKVEHVATDIVRALIDSATMEGQPGIRFLHHSSGKRVRPHEFKAYMERESGEMFEEVDLETWIERAREEGLEELIVSYLWAVVGRGETLVFPFMGGKV